MEKFAYVTSGIVMRVAGVDAASAYLYKDLGNPRRMETPVLVAAEGLAAVGMFCLAYGFLFVLAAVGTMFPWLF